MSYLVAILGLAIAVIGLIGAVEPRRLLGLVDKFWTGERSLNIAVGLRIGIGTLLILAAPFTNFPPVITAVGVVTFLAGIGLIVLGYERVDKLIQWFKHRPLAVVRVSAMAAVAFGTVLMLAGA